MPYNDKETQKAYQRKYYVKNLRKVLDRKNKRQRALRNWFKDWKDTLHCKRCAFAVGIALDFHHKDPKKKLYAVGSMLERGFSKENIMKEASKCMILCANCHRIEHFQEKK